MRLSCVFIINLLTYWTFGQNANLSDDVRRCPKVFADCLVNRVPFRCKPHSQNVKTCTVWKLPHIHSTQIFHSDIHHRIFFLRGPNWCYFASSKRWCKSNSVLHSILTISCVVCYVVLPSRFKADGQCTKGRIPRHRHRYPREESRVSVSVSWNAASFNGWRARSSVPCRVREISSSPSFIIYLSYIFALLSLAMILAGSVRRCCSTSSLRFAARLLPKSSWNNKSTAWQSYASDSDHAGPMLLALGGSVSAYDCHAVVACTVWRQLYSGNHKSSSKPEVHSVLPLRQKNIEPRPRATYWENYCEVRTCGFWDMRADKQTDRQTDPETCSSQHFARSEDTSVFQKCCI